MRCCPCCWGWVWGWGWGWASCAPATAPVANTPASRAIPRTTAERDVFIVSPFSEDVDYQLRRRHRQPCSQPPTRGDAGSGTIVSVRRIARRIVLVALASGLVLVAGRGSADAQPSPARRAIEPRADRRELEQSTQELIAAARAYQASLEALLPFQEAAVARATEAVAKRRELLTRGIVARRDVDEAERAREAAETKLEATRAELTQSETLVAE